MPLQVRSLLASGREAFEACLKAWEQQILGKSSAWLVREGL